eukprot:scpid74873/ scgid29119/ 
MMRCYTNPAQQQTEKQKKFNYCLIRTRRVVENALGRLKARWRILVKNYIRDAEFPAQVSVAACVLHNIGERSSCQFENEWLVDDDVAEHHADRMGVNAAPDTNAKQIRTSLANLITWVNEMNGN